MNNAEIREKVAGVLKGVALKPGEPIAGIAQYGKSCGGGCPPYSEVDGFPDTRPLPHRPNRPHPDSGPPVIDDTRLEACDSRRADALKRIHAIEVSAADCVAAHRAIEEAERLASAAEDKYLERVAAHIKLCLPPGVPPA